MASFVVGDVHGQADALHRRLERLGFRPARDTLTLAGDLVGGPDSLDVLRWVASAGCIESDELASVPV